MPQLRLATFPEDMEDMVVMAAAMEDMEVMVMERGPLMLRPQLKLMLSQDTFPEDMVDMVVMAVAMEAMEEDIMVNCYNYFSFPPLTITMNWPQNKKVE